MAASKEDPITKAQHGLYGTPAYNASGAAIMSFQPINQIHQHLCGLHVYAHDPTRAVEAHHFCTHLRGDLHQCVIYDSAEAGARLIGIEYVITEPAFEALPSDEKKYWHSHKYEVGSGMLKLGTKALVPSMVDSVAERPAMIELHRTYGKTFHTWQYDTSPDIPLGPPQLMMAFTSDESVEQHKDKVAAMDKSLGVSTAQRRKEREGYLPKEDQERHVAQEADNGLDARGQLEYVEKA